MLCYFAYVYVASKNQALVIMQFSIFVTLPAEVLRPLKSVHAGVTGLKNNPARFKQTGKLPL